MVTSTATVFPLPSLSRLYHSAFSLALQKGEKGKWVSREKENKEEIIKKILLLFYFAISPFRHFPHASWRQLFFSRAVPSPL
jgi:hypothetical protein